MFGAGGCEPPIEPAGWTDYNAGADEMSFLPLTCLGAVRAEVQTTLPFAIASRRNSRCGLILAEEKFEIGH
jgi:hypothetical protein